MSVVVKCAGYMALIHEGSVAFLTMVHMVNYYRVMKFDMVDVLILIMEMCKIICFGHLAFGVISRSKFQVKLWLIMAYVQIKWGAVGELIFNTYAYLFTEKYNSHEEFMKELSDTHAPLMGQVLTRVGIMLLVYRYYKSLEPPKKKTKAQLSPKAAELKAK